MAVRANNRPTYCLIQYVAFISFPCSSNFWASAAAVLEVEAAAAVVALFVGAMARVRAEMGATCAVHLTTLRYTVYLSRSGGSHCTSYHGTTNRAYHCIVWSMKMRE